MEHFTLTVITAKEPTSLSTRFELSEQGEIEAYPGEQFIEGTCEEKSLNVADFAELLKSLTPSNALCYGRQTNPTTDLQEKDRESGMSAGETPALPCAISSLAWPDGAGVLRLDLDGSMSKKKFLESLYKAWPELEHHPHVWWTSPSSGIHRTSEKKETTKGIKGQRLYIPVQNARDIPRAGKVLFDRLGLADLGRLDASKTGTLLERSTIDTSVWRPDALDRCGRAVCGDGLTQKRPDPVIHNSEAPFIDTKAKLPNLEPSEEKRLREICENARSLAEEKIARAQELWIEERSQEAFEKMAAEGRSKDKDYVTDLFRRALINHQLLADFELQSEKYGPVTVKTVLEDPSKFHDTWFADPLEPEFENGKEVARAHLKVATTPYLRSRAHRGVRYTLMREMPTIEMHPGQLHAVIAECLKVIRADVVVYNCGGKLGRVTKDGILPVTAAWLRIYLNKLAQFRRFDKHPDGPFSNCPMEIAQGMMALAGDWELPSIRGILKAPTIDLDGRIISLDGFDDATGMYLDFPDAAQWSDIPAHITDDQIREAVELAWFPFRDFPFVGSVDRGVMLASVLTAPVHQSFPTSPGFAFVAPCAGSGKTLLAKCIATLAGEESPAMLPPADNEELRKRIFSFARSGARVMVLDNVVGAIESDALCAYLTAEYTADRVLGASSMGIRPANAMVVLTGNNIVFTGDLNRRILKCEIDPAIERPYVRRFDQDPLFFVQENRVAMVRAILLIMLAFKRSGIQVAQDSMASFETWSDLIRQAVIWIGQLGLLDVADPGQSVILSYEEDPDLNKLRALIATWRDVFGNTPCTVRAAMDKVRKKSASESSGTDKEDALYEAMLNITEERGQINPRKLGWWIKQHSKRVVSGMRFMEHRKRGNSCSWSVDNVA